MEQRPLDVTSKTLKEFGLEVQTPRRLDFSKANKTTRNVFNCDKDIKFNNQINLS